MKTLREWLIDNNVTHRDMAKRLGTSQQNVTRWTGPVTPSFEMIALIERETQHEVTFESFLLNEKFEGDRRLVDAGKAPSVLLDRWVAKE
jgi:transcriptional regulator with XRE-family HTH domain